VPGCAICKDHLRKKESSRDDAHVHEQVEQQDESPSPNVLPVGQPCSAQTSLASLMPCDIVLHDVSVEALATNDQSLPGQLSPDGLHSTGKHAIPG
jgi:hypothetical protein